MVHEQGTVGLQQSDQLEGSDPPGPPGHHATGIATHHDGGLRRDQLVHPVVVEQTAQQVWAALVQQTPQSSVGQLVECSGEVDFVLAADDDVSTLGHLVERVTPFRAGDHDRSCLPAEVVGIRVQVPGAGDEHERGRGRLSGSFAQVGELRTCAAGAVGLGACRAGPDDDGVGKGPVQAEEVPVVIAGHRLGVALERDRSVDRADHVGSDGLRAVVGERVVGGERVEVEVVDDGDRQKSAHPSMVSEDVAVVSLTVAASVDRTADRPDGGRIVRLVARDPEVSAEQLLAGLVPPPLFVQVSFDSYLPDPSEPTQVAAVTALRAFAESVAAPARSRSRWRRANVRPEGRSGVYLDGGFGVGKTHLLAALWRAVEAPAAFATFVELTQLVGALGFADSVERLQDYRVLCIDEFELDDPGDTVLMSTLLTRLAESDVRLAATSNTLPDRLGEDRFAAGDFLREIHGLAARFSVIRIEGPDYRHRGLVPSPQPMTDGHLDAEATTAAARGEVVAADDFDPLLAHLAHVHPSRYGALVEGLDAVAWKGVRTLEDQAAALRLAVLVDRLYDHDVRVLASGVGLDRVFAAELLTGGYRKKYFRALSRLAALATR